MRRAAVTGLVALVLLCGVLLFVPRLRDARLTLGAVLARFGVLVGMESEDVTFRSADVSLSGTIVFPDHRNQPHPLCSCMGRAESVECSGWRVCSPRKGLPCSPTTSEASGSRAANSKEGCQQRARPNLDLLAQDAAAAASVLVQHPRTGEAPVGYIGVSQGGWIVPIAASRPPAVSFMLFFSGPVATVSEECHFSNLAENDRRFWQTHSRADVAEYMKSVRYSDGDVDPRAHLATLQVPGFWAFGGQDNIMPVDVSVTRLRELIARGQSQFQYREYPGYGHELVVFDFSTIGLSQAFKDSVEWISNIRAPVPGASTAVPSQPRWSAVGVMLRTP